MTKDDIIRMAQSAGVSWGLGISGMEDFLVRFAARVAAHEREACAKVADEWVHAYEHPSKVIAETIRARGQAS
mgnify:CR=1 FL=1